MRIAHRPRIRALPLAWLSILSVGLTTHLWAPILLRVPVMAAIPILTCWTGIYFALGPRPARRYLLTMKFIAANWNRTDVIVARKTKATRARKIEASVRRKEEAMLRRAFGR